jgi:hypothetical protein
MTAQKLFSADFREIPSIELTCKSGASVSIPMLKNLIGQRLECPGCREPFWENSNDHLYQIVAKIVSGVSDWKRLDSPDSKDVKLGKIGFSIAMQE